MQYVLALPIVAFLAFCYDEKIVRAKLAKLPSIPLQRTWLITLLPSLVALISWAAGLVFAQAANDLANIVIHFDLRAFVVAAEIVAVVIVEEVIFRGVLLLLLIRFMSIKRAVILQAVIFALAHAAFPLRMLPAFIVGFFLGRLTVRTGSLMYAVVCHSALNLAAFLLTFNEADAYAIVNVIGSVLSPLISGAVFCTLMIALLRFVRSTSDAHEHLMKPKPLPM